MSEIEISVVIPCYSSADWLSKLVEEIRAVLAENNRVYEIILVNDCSPDNGKHHQRFLQYVQTIRRSGASNYGKMSVSIRQYAADLITVKVKLSWLWTMTSNTL